MSLKKLPVFAAALIGLAAASLAPTGGCVSAAPDFRQTINKAEKAVFPALVYIHVVRKDLDSGKDEKAVVAGSGVLITADGEFLTNFHVIEKATEIRCLLTDGSAFDAKLVGSDKDLDIALLRLRRPKGAPALPFATLSTNRVEIGSVVLAMGAPWGLARSVSMGIISCADRYLEESGLYTLWYQTDAAISPGNSGGPLVDTDGLVVGINARGVSMGAQAFTIPSPIILEVLPNLRRYGDAHWAWFGIRFQPLHDFNRNIVFDATSGVVVAGTELKSPARAAGFRPNDRIVSIDGEPVTVRTSEGLPALERRLGRRPIGTNAVFGVVRDGRALTVACAPRAKGAVEGAEKVYARWGFTAKEINAFDTPDLAFFAPDGGVFVSAIAWDGNADHAGLKQQDIVRAIDGRPVQSLAGLSALYKDALGHLDVKTRMTLAVLRRGQPVEIVLNYLEDTEKETL